MNIDQQYELLTWGTQEILTKDDFKKKLSESIKNNKPLNIKLGVDPTAPDIHLGHTVVLRKLRQFQDLGHNVVLLIGGFTSQIGDPSGKSKTRPPLTNEEIEENAKTYMEQVNKILSKERLQIVDNRDWLNSLTLKEALKLLSYSTMSKLLEHNTFKDRFNNAGSIRMHEFIYPFLQAYDSIHLKSDIELGGSDQLFNIAFGRELQKEYGQSPQSALLMPILTGTDGVQKMSKSLNNYIGVTDSLKVMKQKLLNMPDSNIVQYMKLLTNIEPKKVLEIEKEFGSNPDTKVILGYKNLLIEEILSIYHSDKSESDVDVFKVPIDKSNNGLVNIIEAMKLVGFIKSNREAFTLIQSGAVKINGEKVIDKNFSIDLNNGNVELSVGKKKFVTLSF